MERKFKCGVCGHVFTGERETTWESAKKGEYWFTAQGYVGKCPGCSSYAKEISHEEDEQKNIEEQEMDKIKEMFNVNSENGKKAFLCPVCAHKDVCSKIDEPSRQCENFMDATGPQRHSSIYHFFQPIFDWIKFHYPAGEVKFIVDHNSAKMYIEHGPGVFSNEINALSVGILPGFGKRLDGEPNG